MKTRSKTLFLTQFSVLLALEAIVCFTPLGSIPIGPIVATLACVPVIATGILLGTAAGAAMGAFAGFFSLIVWTFFPPNPLLAFVFSPFYSLGTFTGNAWSLVICIVPRTLVGAVAGWCHKLFKNDVLSYGLSGALGSLTNTVLVLGGIFLFFGTRYAEVNGVAYNTLLGALGMVALINGIPEAVIGALAGFLVCMPIKKYVLRGRQ